MAHFAKLSIVTLVATGALAMSGITRACPFCDAPAQTLSEETAAADAVVLAKLIKEADPTSDANDPNSGMATFEVIEVLRGNDALGDAKELKAVHFGESNKDQIFLISGLGTESIDWTTPLALSDAAVEYVRRLPTVPATGPDRIAFFQEYLEHPDPLLAQDAYDEFARSPYEDVQALAPRMHHDKLIEWISDLEINPSRRRLYFTMLGACGTNDDLPLLESMIVSDFTKVEPTLKQTIATGMAMRGPIGLPALYDIVQQQERQKKLGLDALVACYLTLRGGDGLNLIDERFLKDPSVDYTYIYSTIMALRFHGDQETGAVPRDRLLQSIRLLLENKDFADQVVLDLSRWEDWSVLDQLVEMFKTADENSYIRQPVVTYLTVASEQSGDVGTKAAAALEELEEFDPETVKQARSLMAFGALARAKAGGDASGATEGAEKPKAEPATDTTAFAASDADRTTDAAEIPDPAAYEEGQSDTATVADASQAATAAADSRVSPPEMKTAPNGDQASAATPSKSDASATTNAVEAAHSSPKPLLIIGVPILAAALLLGIYWTILRVGAV